MEKTTEICDNILKIQSVREYNKGTILHEDDTGLTYKVLECVRIRISRDQPQFGLILEEIR